MMTNVSPQRRLPPWLRRQIGNGAGVREVKKILREGGLHTVCEEARCPNLGECFNRKTAAFLILGNKCTRSCSFCAVTNGRPPVPEPEEPEKVAGAARAMGLDYIVITSVTRDDLPDGGAGCFAETIEEVRRLNEGSTIEVLTPDFDGEIGSIDIVCKACPDVYNHNIETVSSLYGKVRPAADYGRSLSLLNHVKTAHPDITTKSGLMLGLGESMDEVIGTLEDLRDSGCDLVTIGQYMRPARQNLEVVRYVKPEVFVNLERIGRDMGFKGVYSGPLVRSSYNAHHLKSAIDN